MYRKAEDVDRSVDLDSLSCDCDNVFTTKSISIEKTTTNQNELGQAFIDAKMKLSAALPSSVIDDLAAGKIVKIR